MANRDMPSPIKGVSESLDPSKQVPLTSGYMNNVRAIDVLERQVRIGQRPGLDKVFDEQISGLSMPIVAITQVTTID